jgi:tetratricopeptide (TPR) repeat protein
LIEFETEEFETSVREALEHLWEPSYLRRSRLLSLAQVRRRAEQRTFPATPTDLIRVLRDILREAIDSLKPNEREQHGARRWRPYHLLHYTYWEEQPGDVVATRLYISRRTFYRDLTKSVRQLADVLRDMESRFESQVIPLGKRVESPPTIRNFVGRKEELTYYRELWDMRPLIVVEGIAGIGKTSLGAELVQRYAKNRPIFWYTFRSGLNDDIHSILLALAAFLARQGNRDLWHFLQFSNKATTPQPLNLKISYLVNSLEAANYILCFDDFHLVNEDARLRALFDELQDRVKPDGLSLLIISRQTPIFVKELVCPPLEGMNRADARQLLDRTELPGLSEELFHTLHEKTGGHPQLLNLFVAWTMGQKDSGNNLQQFVTSMPGARQVHHYLLHNVYASLTEDEQKVAKALALLRPPTDVPAIRAVVGDRFLPDARTVIGSLARKHVVEELTTGENVVFFHPIIREFCYALTAENLRREWHDRAAVYFEGVNNYVEAAYHFLHAGSHNRCAAILVPQSEALINDGQCQPMLDLLTKLDQRQLTPEQWLGTCLARSEALIHTAAYKDAIAHLQAALQFPQLSEEQRARIFHKLSWSYEILGQMDQALTYAQEGLELFEGATTYSPEAGPLLRDLAWVYHRRGANQQAYDLMSQALEVLKDSDHYRKELGGCYRARGMIAMVLGHLEQAKADTQRGLEISEQIEHTLGVAMAFNNLGVVAAQEEKWQETLTYFEKSLAQRQQIGDMYGLVMSYNNLGELYLHMGNLVQGQEYLEQSLTLASNLGMRHMISATLGVLAVALTAAGDQQGALEHLARALDIAEADGYWDQAADFYHRTADILLNTHAYDQALDRARRALEIAEEMDDPVRQVEACKLLGQAYLALDRRSEAKASLRQALGIAQARGADQDQIVVELETLVARLEHPQD